MVLDEVVDARVPCVGDEVEVGVDLLGFSPRQFVPVARRVPQPVRAPCHNREVTLGGKQERALGRVALRRPEQLRAYVTWFLGKQTQAQNTLGLPARSS